MNRSKFLLFFGSLLLVCLPCTLSSIAPIGYVHCHFTDACEFLNFAGESGKTKKPKIIKAVINKNADPIPSTKEYELFISFNILNKYISPYQKNLHSPFITWSNFLIDHQENISPSPENCLPFQALQIVGISIIKS